MANGRIPFIVKAPNGTDLRREPHTNSKTEDGDDNVILSLPKGTYVRLENEDIYATDKYQWVLVSLEFERKTITGWVIFDDLGPPSIGAGSNTYPVSFLGKNYKIYRDKLKPAKQLGYILRYSSERASLDGMLEITIRDSRCLTTHVNMDVLKSSGWIV